MIHEIRFALYAIQKNIAGSAELRTSFLMNIMGMVINNSAFILLWVFFVDSVGVIGGWTAIDIVGLQGFTAFAYGITFSFGCGVRKIPEYIATGAFDRFMVSPKNLLLRVATAFFTASPVGDIVFGMGCFFLYGIFAHITFVQWLILSVLALVSVVLFFACTVIIFTISFYFLDAGNVSQGFFELFMTPTLFHGGAFQGMLRFLFTFVVPSLLVGAIPVEAVKSVSVTQIGIMLLLTTVWMIVAIFFFNRSVRRYESANLTTFGI